MKSSLLVITAVLLALGVWHLAGPAWLPAHLQTKALGESLNVPAIAKLANPAKPPVIYRCSKGSAITYSDAPCPKDQQQREVKDSAVSVFESPRPSSADKLKSPAVSAHIPNARAFLGNASNPTVIDKNIERATR